METCWNDLREVLANGVKAPSSVLHPCAVTNSARISPSRAGSMTGDESEQSQEEDEDNEMDGGQ